MVQRIKFWRLRKTKLIWRNRFVLEASRVDSRGDKCCLKYESVRLFDLGCRVGNRVSSPMLFEWEGTRFGCRVS